MTLLVWTLLGIILVLWTLAGILYCASQAARGPITKRPSIGEILFLLPAIIVTLLWAAWEWRKR